jgi:hypothetical protein
MLGALSGTREQYSDVKQREISEEQGETVQVWMWGLGGKPTSLTAQNRLDCAICDGRCLAVCSDTRAVHAASKTSTP